MFDNLGAAGTGLITGPAPPRALAERMHAAWIRFARDGDPGWRPFDESHPVMVFDAADSTLALDPRGDERRVWPGG